MTSGSLSHEEFFNQLAILLEQPRKKSHGSIHLTQKRLSYEVISSPDFAAKKAKDPLWDLHLSNPLPILIRATNGKPREKRKAGGEPKVKISTVVQPDEMEGFFARYADVCKAGMSGLKKRDRTKRKKDRAKKKKTTTAASGGDSERKN